MSDSDSATEQSVQDIDHEWEEWDGEDDEEDVTCSLFDGTLLPSPAAALTHDAKVHGFDFAAYVKQVTRHAVLIRLNHLRARGPSCLLIHRLLIRTPNPSPTLPPPAFACQTIIHIAAWSG
jgi:hypothetical protein